MLLTLECQTYSRAQKAESEQELLILEFLGLSNLFVYHWCHKRYITDNKRKQCLTSYMCIV